MLNYLETSRLNLCRPRLSEVPELFQFLGDQAAMRHTHCDANIRECRKRIAVHERRRRRDGFAPWTVRLKATGKIIGWGGLYDDPFDPGWGIELGYYFDPTSWGNGYATELCQAALDYSDRHVKAESVTAFAQPDNAASKALLIKHGFKHQRFVKDMNRNLYNRVRRVS
ncbi:GNAT family N-acetyltransferase [Thalassobius sp. Cn5-15]|uniref:GNAT family N-acetyltransferase n=1 Tax=Thalassobius sp. Cn5-15 TaxID=2917763 RepID=UPI002103DE98|nr:GNAT family N-acetyltransferase [Thalassobius sp. Cn5-15]